MLSRLTVSPPQKGASHRQTLAVATVRNSSNGGASALFEERLDNIMVMELRDDGTSEYKTMNLRTLYHHVVTCISRNCKQACMEKAKKDAVALGGATLKAAAMFKKKLPNRALKEEENEGRGAKFSEETSGARPQSGEEGSAPPPKPSLKATRIYKSFRDQRKVVVFGTDDDGESAPTERLGGYLHPRDMRRLVTPFSGSNEPQLMVRRHVMLLNFDPLRAIVLKDKLLVLVPEGADSIFLGLEKKIKAGFKGLEDDVFGASKRGLGKFDSTATDEDMAEDDEDEGGWEDIANLDWSDVPYELLSLDSILQTVASMLADDARQVIQRSVHTISELRGSPGPDGDKKKSGMPGESSQERLRWLKDEINAMEGRVQAFVRALNEKLDDDEGMALMNLSRVLSHPQRFVQGVAPNILHEESDEPELILENYMQQALSIVNMLDTQKLQIATTQEQISMTLDAMRNKLLYINTVVSLGSFVVGSGSFIGSLFGMNVVNPYQDLGVEYFYKVTWGTVVGMVSLMTLLTLYFFWQTMGIRGMK